MKTKKIALAMMFIATLLLLAACGSTPAEPIKAVDGYAQGRVGDTFVTAFFDFSVDSVKYVDKFGDATPAEGMMFIDATITLKNTMDEEITMFINEFQIDWGEGDEQWGFPMEGLAGAAADEYSVKRGEKVTNHYVFEVEKDSKEFYISFLEYFADDTEGDLFFCYFEK